VERVEGTIFSWRFHQNLRATGWDLQSKARY
jgi:hypothetical protein